VILLANAGTIVISQFCAGLPPLLQYGMPTSSTLPTEVKLKPSQLSPFAGTYELPADLLAILGTPEDDAKFTVTAENGHLIQHTEKSEDLGVFRPTSEKRFFRRGSMETIEAKYADDGTLMGFDFELGAIGYRGFVKKIK
jgi:hypothetical protein